MRYVRALSLVRRRRLRVNDMQKTDDGDKRVRWGRRGEGKTREVVAPEGTREDLLKAQERLTELFDADLEAGEL